MRVVMYNISVIADLLGCQRPQMSSISSAQLGEDDSIIYTLPE